MKILNKKNIMALSSVIIAVALIAFYESNNKNDVSPYTLSSEAVTSPATKKVLPSYLIQTQKTDKTLQPIIQSDSAYYLNQLSKSGSDNELLSTLRDLILINEEAVLSALKNLDYEKFSGRRIGSFLVEYFAEYSDVFDTIDKLTMFENSAAHFLYEDVSAGLLASHSSHLDTGSVVEFLSKQKNSVIALKAMPDVGRQMMESESDKAFVVDNITAMPDIENKESLLYGALEQWLKQDPDSLLEYLDLHEHRPAYDRVVSQYVHQYKDQNPEKVMELALAIKDNEQRFMAVYGTAQELAKQTPDVYINWIETVTNTELKERIIEAVGEIN
ncbi:hypothetical protein ACM9HF_03775 [Colwellia sp. RE-S-Sl-9]